jgi:CRISPR-associated protein Csm4
LGTFDYSKACKKDKVPKIAVDRVTRSTNLYHTGFVQFEWKKNPAGLYFLLQINPEGQNYEGKLHAALELLGEEGLGGERSSGAGRFKLNWCDLPADWHDLINFKQGNSHTILSLYWDSNIKSEDLETSSYEIIERGGWIAENQLRRKMVRMFKEGSVFPNQPQGKLANVTPKDFKGNYKIYRSGISLSLPIKVKEEE